MSDSATTQAKRGRPKSDIDAKIRKQEAMKRHFYKQFIHEKTQQVFIDELTHLIAERRKIDARIEELLGKHGMVV